MRDGALAADLQAKILAPLLAKSSTAKVEDFFKSAKMQPPKQVAALQRVLMTEEPHRQLRGLRLRVRLLPQCRKSRPPP